MKKILLGLAIGVAIGYAMANRRNLGASDDDVSGVYDSVTRHPSTERLSGSAGRIVDLANERGARVVQQARRGIQRRLTAGSSDL